MVYNILETFDDSFHGTLKETKERIEKRGQHKLGQGGYLKLQSRIVSSQNLFVSLSNIIIIAANNIKNTYSCAMQGEDFKNKTMEEVFWIGYKYGYKYILKCRRSMGKTPRSSLQDKVNKNQSTLTFHYL